MRDIGMSKYTLRSEEDWIRVRDEHRLRAGRQEAEPPVVYPCVVVIDYNDHYYEFVYASDLQ